MILAVSVAGRGLSPNQHKMYIKLQSRILIRRFLLPTLNQPRDLKAGIFSEEKKKQDANNLKRRLNLFMVQGGYKVMIEKL